jgi:hypothetical protein
VLHPGTQTEGRIEVTAGLDTVLRSEALEGTMEFELEYVRSRAIEEREAARKATSSSARKAHVELAQAFERHADKIQHTPA